jgi:hypothetical protein
VQCLNNKAQVGCTHCQDQVNDHFVFKHSLWIGTLQAGVSEIGSRVGYAHVPECVGFLADVPAGHVLLTCAVNSIKALKLLVTGCEHIAVGQRERARNAMLLFFVMTGRCAGLWFM